MIYIIPTLFMLQRFAVFGTIIAQACKGEFALIFLHIIQPTRSGLTL